MSLSGVIGKTHDQVLNSLEKYTRKEKGGLQEAELKTDDDHCCILQESVNNTTISYPGNYLEWDKSSEFISKDLNAPVFSFHIHDGDLWMYTLYVNGKIEDQFNPIPDYWDDSISDEEIDSWKGDASVVAKYVGQSPNNISKYLTRWDLDDEGTKKAYDDDEFTQEDWQLIDFMKKCGLAFPVDEDRNAKGKTYKLWTKESLANSPNVDSDYPRSSGSAKPWWKFWG